MKSWMRYVRISLAAARGTDFCIKRARGGRDGTASSVQSLSMILFFFLEWTLSTACVGLELGPGDGRDGWWCVVVDTQMYRHGGMNE